MTMTASALSTQLQTISGATEEAAIAAWAVAWAAYFAGAVAGSGPGVAFTTNPTNIASARAAMAAQMTGLSATGAGAGKIQAGIIGWWDYLVAHPATFFSGAASITKPANLTSIAAALPTVFDNNKATSASAAVACLAVATSIHGNNTGGSSDLGSIT